jgi:trehalose 6-phosphate synthase
MIVVSNRLPISVQRQGDGVRLEPSPGGLATALSAVQSTNKNGLWIGWPGVEVDWNVDGLLTKFSKKEAYDLKAVTLTPEEVEKFYAGFANEIIWPLFHDLPSLCHFKPDYWEMYQRVNRKFAQSAADEAAGSEDFIWIQDYHLMLVAQYLRELNISSKLAFFLHIPFPSPEVFEKLPWREPVLKALLNFDLLGFQTERDRGNFLNCVTRFLSEVQAETVAQQNLSVRVEGRRVLAGAFPISIDYDEFAGAAAEPEVAARAAAIRGELMENTLVLGVDRMDYTKGIPERLQAFRILLERFPELRHQITLVQIVVPSRSEIPDYQDLRQEVELLVSQINGQFTQPGWVPIHYMYRSVQRQELLAYYRAADVALITPLKDGMNLVAKEFCAAQADKRGVLILSEFAGASSELRHGALLVNPNDFVGVAQAIHEACSMSAEEKRNRMRLLREIVKNHNVQRWARAFLAAADSISSETVARARQGTQGSGDPREPGTPGVALVARAASSPFVKRSGASRVQPALIPGRRKTRPLFLWR